MDAQTLQLLIGGLKDTLLIIAGSSLVSYVFGFPLGVILVVSQKGGLYPKPVLNTVLNRIINLFRSIPFYILVVALMPLSRFVVGTSLGIKATIFSLSIGAIPFVARLVESALAEIDPDVTEAVITMGAKPIQIITQVWFKEALPALVQGTSITSIMLIGYSAMAGLMGGGGLGDIAIRYGYYRFNFPIMYESLILLIVLVEVIQTTLSWWVKKLDKRNR